MWKLSCARLSRFDEALLDKEAEIEALNERILQLENVVDPTAVPLMVPRSPTFGHHSGLAVRTPGSHRRQGQVPPVSEFTGEEHAG